MSRQLVAQGPADPRFQNAFADATGIFATNDVKYHVNKRRALRWAAEHEVVARYGHLECFLETDGLKVVIVEPLSLKECSLDMKVAKWTPHS